MEKKSEVQVALSNHQIICLVQTLEQLLVSGVHVEEAGMQKLLGILKGQDLSFLQSPVPTLSENIISSLSHEQLETLKVEIQAYRNLSRNVPLSPALLAHLSPPSQHDPRTPFYARPPINFPLDLIVQAKLEARLRELQMLPRDLPPKVKQQTEIELTKMRLLRRQQEIRNEIAHELRCAVALHTTEDSSCYNRERVHIQATETDRFAQDQEKRRKKKHNEYLEAVIAHSKAFKEFHNAASQKMKRVNRTLMNYHVSKLRKEQQMKEKEEKERLRALKENDEVAYLKLLEKTKNDRLTQLLHQTDEYLSQIGALVSKAKVTEDTAEITEKEKPREVDLNEMTEEEKKQFYEAEEEEAKQLESTKTYYTIAHTIKEDVKKQPDCLVGGTLKRYQLKGLQWLVSLYNNNLHGVLADEMGLGKTIQTIALLTYLMEKKGCQGPFLIIVPLSVLSNWRNELDHWAPSIVNVIYKGAPKVRKDIYFNQMVTGKYNSVLTTFDYVMRDKKYLSKVDWSYIIVDEGHRMKNAQSKLTLTLSKFYRSRHRLLLTGTPLQNSIPELWSLLNFLLPTIFNSVENFENWFSAPFAAAGETVEMNEEENLLIIHRLHKVLRPFLLRRLKIEVEDQLPAKVEKVLRCGFSAMQKRLYDIMQDNGRIPSDPNSKQKTPVQGLMNTLMQLRKVCNHPYLFSPGGEYIINEDLIRSSGKLVLLDQVLPKLKESGHRVLIFSQMTALMTILGYYLNYRGYKHLRLDGSTKSEDRTEYMRLFNEKDSEYFVFMLSTRAGGLGLNLQTADTVILFDSDWNPQIDLQAQDRAHRIGQTKEVRVLRFITAESVEEDILARANHKLDVDKKIIQAGMFNNNSSASQRRDYLVKLLQKRKDAADANKIPSASSVNRIIARSEEEFQLFEKMDQERKQRDLEIWKARGNPGSPPPPLMTEEDLPPWLQQDFSVPEDIEELEYGRGMRSRGDVCYDDSMTDARFTKMIETGVDPGGRKRRREEMKEMWDEGNVFGEAEEAEEEEEEDIEDDEPERKKPRLRSPIEQENLNHKLSLVLDAVEASFDKSRARCELFMVLPSKRDYPDYYLVIKNPIDITTIRKRIEEDYYENAASFKEDIDTLFTNAKTYNMETSQVHVDAVVLQNLCHSRLKDLFSPQELLP